MQQSTGANAHSSSPLTHHRSKSISSILSQAAEDVKQKITDTLLYTYEELPSWQQDNEMILTGYIRETNSWKLCLRSLTFFHNETINIYSHGISAAIYLLLLVFFFTNLIYLPSFPTTTLHDYLVLDIYLLGAATCLTLSSCFHCLKQHSQSQSDIWSKMDYIGIICLITCSTISLLYFGYRDHFNYFKFFAISTFILAITCTVFVTMEKFNTRDWKHVRALFFIAFAGSGLIPLITGINIFGFPEVWQRVQLPSLTLELICYVIGALLYGYRIPEVFAPGKFDNIGNSHQWFHIFVVLGSLLHLRALVGSYYFMHSFLLATRKQKL
ncbi:hypothetical protein TBLA_0B02290 [Henningerozyma blattae CBS 6284]|uniref:Uncharacterized protein n=1 Tax=Henningerozyma blattae (strain ATCC 34711 / CBS 6284 / DSM 70876 / NBRC 10599 / NRRL Y-10934 / UCD 77-7) TaxID=1071380 RepID=I2GY69_HENB6|nr:hypothetical protein TBLA_0B02290 [Tetrapisispora blattae CBS 6284]CCH59071.1 hypothetical protein TBLA_0B02290 [Tetrapisispora blattae CBS 6284]